MKLIQITTFMALCLSFKALTDEIIYEISDAENSASLFVDTQAGLRYIDWWVDIRKPCLNNSQSIESIDYTKGGIVTMLRSCYGDGYTLTPILDIEKKLLLDALEKNTNFNFGMMVFDTSKYGDWLTKRRATDDELVTLYRLKEAVHIIDSELNVKDVYERGWLDSKNESNRTLSSLEEHHAKKISEIEAGLERKFKERMANFKANSDLDLSYVRAEKNKYKTASIAFVLSTMFLLSLSLIKSRKKYSMDATSASAEIKKLRKRVRELEIKSCIHGLEKQ